MTLTDADVAQLAREVVDARDPDLDIRIDPLGRDDPYRLGTDAWTVHAGGASSYLTATMTRAEAERKLRSDLTG